MTVSIKQLSSEFTLESLLGCGMFLTTANAAVEVVEDLAKEGLKAKGNWALTGALGRTASFASLISSPYFICSAWEAAFEKRDVGTAIGAFARFSQPSL